eukprot:TRINITY_DN9859_c0_g1_i1.p1 TRINITY_DN9859_c0_g1~~TRINITY_DN9859_c0_g1_i1.p1  ORF type:complete len:206 (-),score=29.86 TRINITY_DN9859_c0_g1_i1:20-637(-)
MQTMLMFFRNIVALVALFYGVPTLAAEEREMEEECDGDEMTLLQVHSAVLADKANDQRDPSESQHRATSVELQDQSEAIKDEDVLLETTTDGDEKDDGLLSVNASLGCPSQPQGWNGCARGGLYSVPAFCGHSNRHTLNSGIKMNYKACAFLVANDHRCVSRRFYTSSTSDSTTGVCKCCIMSSPVYSSNACNWVYEASASCNIR